MIDLSAVPRSPGCYLFKDESGRVIYVGKAKDLRKRVKSYFQKRDHDPKTILLVKSISSLDHITTDSELEALILENNLIKRYKPKFNIDLRDSKNYAYIQETDERFPRFQLARRKDGRGRFYGPFVSAQTRDNILYLVNKTFRFRRCRRMPKKACLRYHIKLCSAPCISRDSQDDYMSRVRFARFVLKGRHSELIKKLEREMEAASDSMNFEKALELRDQINALATLQEEQKVDRKRKHNEDIMSFMIRESKVFLLLFNIYKGTLVNKEDYTFELTPDFFEEFLLQYYSENEVPKELIIPVEISEPMHEFLERRRGTKVKVTVPKRGDKKKLLELVNKNIETSFFGDLSKIEDLRDALGLPELPFVIECFDISHLSGTSTVGSMVQFRNARPDKNNYRRFRIRTVEGISDTAGISEVVRRRYYRLVKEKANLPDLIIVDGGIGQLNAAHNSLKESGLSIPVISIAKRFEDIYIPEEPLPIKLPAKSKALQFIREIRDEAHRFAIKYNRLLRGKEMIE